MTRLYTLFRRLVHPLGIHWYSHWYYTRDSTGAAWEIYCDGYYRRFCNNERIE